MATPRIKLTSEEMRYIALFESLTGATVNDCIMDENFDRIIFIAKAGEMGIAIGKAGKNINMLRNMFRKNVEVVEYADSIEGLIRNALAPARVKQVRMAERPDKKIVIVEVDPRDKALAIGKNGRTIDKTRLLARRYFQVDHIQIV